MLLSEVMLPCVVLIHIILRSLVLSDCRELAFLLKNVKYVTFLFIYRNMGVALLR